MISSPVLSIDTVVRDMSTPPSTPSPRTPRPADDAALRRAATHAFTTVDVCRRKWAALTADGSKALTSSVNGALALTHAEGGDWPKGFGAVRRGLERPAARCSI